MCLRIVSFLGCKVINFEINLIFLIQTFFKKRWYQKAKIFRRLKLLGRSFLLIKIFQLKAHFLKCNLRQSRYVQTIGCTITHISGSIFSIKFVLSNNCAVKKTDMMGLLERHFYVSFIVLNENPSVLQCFIKQSYLGQFIRLLILSSTL